MVTRTRMRNQSWRLRWIQQTLAEGNEKHGICDLLARPAATRSEQKEEALLSPTVSGSVPAVPVVSPTVPVVASLLQTLTPACPPRLLPIVRRKLQ